MLTAEERAQICLELVSAVKTVTAAVSVIYKHALECGLPPRVAEEIALYVIRRLEEGGFS